MSKSMPLVTCVIPCYNHERYVQDAINSVLEQDYENIELIVINDGSSDKTHEKICELIKYCELRFRNFVYINQNNSGVTATLNRGLSIAQGEYFTILASDDFFSSNKISKILHIFSHVTDSDNVSCVFGDANFIDEHNVVKKIDAFGNLNQKGLYSTFMEYYCRKRLIKNGLVSYSTILEGNFIPAMASVFTTNSLKSVGGFDTTLRLDDWDIYLKLLRKSNFLKFDDVVSLYRLHGKNSIVTSKSILLKDTIYILNRERRHCKSKGISKIWSEKYNKTLVDLIKCKEYGFFVKSLINPLSFFTFLIKKIGATIFRRI